MLSQKYLKKITKALFRMVDWFRYYLETGPCPLQHSSPPITPSAITSTCKQKTPARTNLQQTLQPQTQYKIKTNTTITTQTLQTSKTLQHATITNYTTNKQNKTHITTNKQENKLSDNRLSPPLTHIQNHPCKSTTLQQQHLTANSTVDSI